MSKQKELRSDKLTEQNTENAINKIASVSSKSSQDELNTAFAMAGHNFSFPTFLKYMDGMDDETYYKYLGEVIVGNYAADIQVVLMHLIFQERSKKHQKNMMTAEMLENYKNLPDNFTVYRGCSKNNIDGWHWTTKRNIAERFASYYPAGVLVTASMSKESCIAYFAEADDPKMIEYGAESENEAFGIVPEENVKTVESIPQVSQTHSNYQHWEYTQMLDELQFNTKYQTIYGGYNE